MTNQEAAEEALATAKSWLNSNWRGTTDEERMADAAVASAWAQVAVAHWAMAQAEETR